MIRRKITQHLHRRLSSAALELPTRHSRNQLPPVCTDPTQLRELTVEVLEAPIGSLFSYDTEKDVVENAIDNHREEAWELADPTVQKVEFLLRGHASGIDGTLWNRWTEQPSNGDASTKLMQELLDRMWLEGHMYMTLRSERMIELFRAPSELESNLEEIAEQMDVDSGDEEQVEASLRAMQDKLESMAEDGDLEIELDDGSEDSESKEESKAYGDDFAFPGPTAAMYDTIMDSLACEGGSIENSWDAMQNALRRHALDGGDEFNTNEYTRPSILLFNGPIRVAASQSYAPSDDTMELRDKAIHLAFHAFDALNHSKLQSANSATYGYLLQVVSKYFPASRMRGNIAHGMWHHACEQGVIDDIVLEAHILANSPTNGEEFEQYRQDYLQGKTKRELPRKWVHNSRRLRYDPQESTY